MSSKATARVSTCCLCAQIAGDRENDLLHDLLGAADYERRVSLESELAAVIPSLGPLAPGHALVCPKQHLRSVAAGDELVREEIWAMAERTAERLKAIFAAPILRFEHGDAERGGEISCSVEHAHLHLLPTAADPWPRIGQEFEWQKLDGPEELPELVAGREYLLYQGSDGVLQVHLPTRKVPSQLLRLRFAEVMGTASAWNWRESPLAVSAAATHEALASFSVEG